MKTKTKRIKICKAEIDNISKKEFFQIIDKLIEKRTPSIVVTPNVDHIINLEKDAGLYQVYKEANVIIPDGTPLIWASKFLKTPLKEKISGSDIFPELCEIASKKNYKVFFLGGRPNAAKKSAEILKNKFPSLQIAGIYCPPFGFEKNPEENKKIIKMLLDTKPDILFVGLGSPKQEKWIYKYKDYYKVPVSIGIGASFEFLSGIIKRAPKLMQKFGLEWFWRLLMEPKRLWKRYILEDPKFFLLILKQKYFPEKTNEKYKTTFSYYLAKAVRFAIKTTASFAVPKKTKHSLSKGYTIILAMSSYLPNILEGNLMMLCKKSYKNLKETLIVIDDTKETIKLKEEEIKQKYSNLKIRFLYYTPLQKKITKILKLPYINCWLSWIIAINECKTEVFFIHDYDALILKNNLEERYQIFMQKKQIFQGIKWYNANGIIKSDKLSSTFEAFVCTSWAKQHKYTDILNTIGKIGNRRVDFDIFLKAQYEIPVEKRTIIPATMNNIIHPSQMIHQFVVAKNHPGKRWHCSATTMIPFFMFLSGLENALSQSAQNIKKSHNKIVNLIGDGTLINFSYLTTKEVTKMLRNMIQVCLFLKIEKLPQLIEYGNALYDLSDTPNNLYWKGNFTKEQRQWIENNLK